MQGNSKGPGRGNGRSLNQRKQSKASAGTAAKVSVDEIEGSPNDKGKNRYMSPTSKRVSFDQTGRAPPQTQDGVGVTAKQGADAKAPQ